jgi:hypothetical protein
MILRHPNFRNASVATAFARASQKLVCRRQLLNHESIHQRLGKKTACWFSTAAPSKGTPYQVFLSPAIGD